MQIWELSEVLLYPQCEADFQPLRVVRDGGEHMQLVSPFSGWSSLAGGSHVASMTFQRRVWCHRP